MYDNNDSRRRNRGKGRDRRAREEVEERNHSEAGSGKGGGRHENFGRRREAAPPDYAEQVQQQQPERQRNRGRFPNGQGVPPPPPPPQQGRSHPGGEVRQDPRGDPRNHQYAQGGPCGVDPERRMGAQMEGYQMQMIPSGQMLRVQVPGQVGGQVALAMPMASQAMAGPLAGPFLATGPVEETYASQARSEELVHTLREFCQARDLSKVIEIIKCLDDEREQIWPVILEDILNVLRELPQRSVTLTSEDAAELIFQLGRVQSPWPKALEPSVGELSKLISEFARYKTEELSPLAISRMVWGFAHLCARSDPLMSVVAAEVVKRIQDFKHQELANTAWAFAKCGLWNEQLASSLARQCLEGIEEFTTESLSNVAWAMAQWSTKDEQLLLKMADALLQKPETYEPHAMATLAWAFSTLSFRPESLMKNILAESTRKISQFSIKEVAHIAWAFANLRFQDSNLFNRIADHIHHQNALMQPGEIANIAWAFAKNHVSNQAIMNRLAQEAVSQIGGFKAAEITMLTWAYAVCNLGHQALMLEIGTKVSQRSIKFTPGQLAHIIWAFGALSLKHENLCEAVAKCCKDDMLRSSTAASVPSSPGAASFGSMAANNYNANSLTQVVWGFAMVQYRDPVFLHEAAGHICRGIEMLKPLSLWRCASAYNAMMVNNKEIKGVILVEALKKQHEFSLKGLSRLLDCYNMHIGQKEQADLEKVMDFRLDAVVEQLRKLYSKASGNYPYDATAHQWLMDSGFLDLQVQGMKKILQKLDIQTPGWSFVSKCFREAKKFWGSQAFAMLELNVAGQHYWTARSIEEDTSMVPQSLQMDVFQLNNCSDCKVLWHVLELACQSGVLDEVQQPEGTVQILLSTVPSSNSIALLLQFMAKFPKIRVDFVEAQVNTHVLSSYLPV